VHSANGALALGDPPALRGTLATHATREWSGRSIIPRYNDPSEQKVPFFFRGKRFDTILARFKLLVRAIS
jgi:hypothetical protein